MALKWQISEEVSDRTALEDKRGKQGRDKGHGRKMTNEHQNPITIRISG